MDIENIFIQIPNYIFWKDLNSLYLGCNASLAQAVGLQHPDEIVGKSDCDMPWAETHTEIYRQGDWIVKFSKKSRR